MNFIASEQYDAAGGGAFITKKSTMAEGWMVTQNPRMTGLADPNSWNCFCTSS